MPFNFQGGMGLPRKPEVSNGGFQGGFIAPMLQHNSAGLNMGQGAPMAKGKPMFGASAPMQKPPAINPNTMQRRPNRNNRAVRQRPVRMF